MDSPLSAKRVVITRRRQQAGELDRRLKALGAWTIFFPTIELVPVPSDHLSTALDKVDAYDWLLFTSANAVHLFFQIFGARPGDPLPPIAVVGTATDAALRDHGQRSVAMPAEFSGRALALTLGDVLNRRILLPRARLGRPEIVEQLVELGALVDDVVLYDTVPASPTPQAVAEIASGVDILTFTSPSTAQNFYSLVKKEAVAKTIVGCIGPTTARAVEELGVKVDVVAAEYTVAGLVDALVQYVGAREKEDVPE